jgi:hypothetical protein
VYKDLIIFIAWLKNHWQLRVSSLQAVNKGRSADTQQDSNTQMRSASRWKNLPSTVLARCRVDDGSGVGVRFLSDTHYAINLNISARLCETSACASLNWSNLASL